MGARRPDIVVEDALQGRVTWRNFGGIRAGKRHHGTRGHAFVAVLRLASRQIDQGADFANAGFPAVAQHGAELRVGLFRGIEIGFTCRKRHFLTLEIERPQRLDVNLACNSGLQLAGVARLVDVNLAHQGRGNVLERDLRAGRGKNSAAVPGGLDVGQATDGQGADFAAGAVGDLDPRHALQRFDDIVIGQLADVFGNDRFDDLVVGALDRQAFDQRCLDAGDDHGRGASRLRRFGGRLRPHRGAAQDAGAGQDSNGQLHFQVLGCRTAPGDRCAHVYLQ